MRKNSCLLLAAIFCAASMAGCGEEPQSTVSSVTETQSATKPEVPEGAIVDASGDFVYTGKLQQVGNDEDGYIKVPLGYKEFQTEESEGVTQYGNAAGTTLISLDYYVDTDYQTAANSMLYYMMEQEGVDGLNGAAVTAAGYNALQVYCAYPDSGIISVSWFIENPANTSSCYFVSMQFTNEDSNIMACSSTFETPADYTARIQQENAN